MLSFFNDIEKIKMFDGLAKVLGASSDGIIEYGYADVVRLAGHSCPTVAGAYMMTKQGLKELYGDKTPDRGGIKVCIRGKLGEGTVGVIANVVSFITGATTDGGFHGLAGKFDRRFLLEYDPLLEGEIRLARVDNGNSVTLSYNPSTVAPAPEMGQLFRKVASNEASQTEIVKFGELWQNRVQAILGTPSVIKTEQLN